MSPIALNSHIHRAADGVAWIDDSNVKVVEIVTDWLAHGSSPEEMHFQFPHLSLAQIHSALAYYYDHKSEFETEVARRLKVVETLRAQSGNQSDRQELLARLARC